MSTLFELLTQGGPVDNMCFIYLHRDASNYKKWGSVVFTNPEQLNSASVGKNLTQSILLHGLFIARQIRIPEVFLYGDGDFSIDDHCYHEFDRAQATLESANDVHGRSMKEFLVEVMQMAQLGWRAFDPRLVSLQSH